MGSRSPGSWSGSIRTNLFDPIAALFAHAVSDPVFSLDASGEPYPTLAAELPVVEAGKTVVRLRQGIVSARGRPLGSGDLMFSINRSRRMGGRAVFADLGAPRAHPRDSLAIMFPTGDAARIARALSSPLSALVPRAFTPDKPDGTGAMRADFTPSRLVLSRNPRAARGASFLDEIIVDQARRSSASLRAHSREMPPI